MGPRAGLYILDKKKILPMLGFEPWTVHSTAYPLYGLRYPGSRTRTLQWHKRVQNNVSDPSITVDVCVCVSERADKIIESMDCFTLHSKRPSSDQSDPLTQFSSVTCRLLSLYLATNATITTTTPDFRVLSSPPRKWQLRELLAFETPSFQ